MRWLPPLLATLLFACPAPPPELALQGPGWRLGATDAGVLTFARDGEPLLNLGLDAFQVGVVSELDPEASYDPYWLVVNDGVFAPTLPRGFAWRAPTSATVTRDGDALLVSYELTRSITAQLKAARAADGHLVLHFTPRSESAIGFLRFRAGVDGSEAFYGLGEWFEGANHRGKLRPLQLEPDFNLESANTENHVAVPFLVGSRGWAFFVETRRHGLMDVAKSDAALVDTMWGTAEESSAGLLVHLFSAADPLDLPRQYYGVTGFPRPPSDWATGPWIWRNESRDQAEVEDDVRKIRELDLATSALWLDRPYATEVNTFDYEPTKFPDAGGMVSTVRAAGLRLALWHTPYLAPAAQPMYGEAERGGFFPPEQGAWLNRWGSPLDLTKPEAVTFWRNLITRYTNAGVEGFKLDFAEDVVAGLGGSRSGWRFANGETDRTMTDGYPRAYHGTYRAVLANLDGFLLVRHARWGEQQAGVVVWPGDIDATLTKFGETFTTRGGDTKRGVGGLPAAIRAGVGLSMSGFPYFASDTGGYLHSPPDKETWLRWVEHAALMPVMQTGDASSQPPWLYTPENGRDAEALETYRQYARLHLRLFPFFWSHVQAMATHGKPVVRAFGLQFPSLGAHPEDQYLLGDELLVAPVETKGATSRTLLKPPGRWFSWWDGVELQGSAGDTVAVDAPLTVLPLFLREGALVPMLRPTIDTLAPSTDPGVESYVNEPGALFVRVQPGTTETKFVMFDGTTLEQAGDRVVASAGMKFKTTVTWVMVQVTRPTSVEHGGVAIPFSYVGNALSFETPLDGQATVWR